MSQIDLYVGRRVRARRRFLAMTQQDLAQACGVRSQQIQKYECAACPISAARLWALAVALNVPVSYFFEGWAARVTPDVRDLIRTYNRLEARPRRRLLDLALSMRAGIKR